ncbi:MAG: hypothetical protein K6B14_02015 [Lachnospiraceae bacterium]|nr:hypothetical protein [Lachnospiraceae bacterium]
MIKYSWFCGEVDLVKNDSKKDTIELCTVAMIIVAFLVFFVLKVNGYFDFTHKYGIREIFSTIDQENVMLMIDGDGETIWNEATFLGETKAKTGDSIRITFDRPRQISGIKVTGDIPKGLVIKTDETEGRDKFTFDKPVLTGEIIMELQSDGEKTWNISELEVME